MTQGGRFLALDALRGVAAIMVVALHATTGGAAPFAPSAYLAVDLFFILSGFVIAHAYGSKLNGNFRVWRDFVAQRVLRLWPLYILGALLGVALHVYGVFRGWRADDLGSVAAAFVANAAFLPTPFTLPSERYSEFPFNPPAWSLFSEMVVNLAFAFLVKTRRLQVMMLACGLGAIALLYVGVRYQGLDVGGDFGLTHLGLARAMFSFFLGVVLYDHRAMFTRMKWRISAPAAMVALALVCLAPFTGTVRTVFDLACVALVFPALVAFSFNEEPRGGLASICSLLGKASYPLYVIHWPLLKVSQLAFERLGVGSIHLYPAALAGVCVAIWCAALALGFLDDWLRKYTRRAIAPAPEARPAPS